MIEPNNEELVEKVRELREKSGMGLMDCKKALLLFDGNINQSYEYLKIRGHAVCRRNPDGTNWNTKNYVEHIKKEFKDI